LEAKAVGEQHWIENFGTVEKRILRTRHGDHLVIFLILRSTGDNTVLGQLSQKSWFHSLTPNIVFPNISDFRVE
jgi:hypothetical protein